MLDGLLRSRAENWVKIRPQSKCCSVDEILWSHIQINSLLQYFYIVLFVFELSKPGLHARRKRKHTCKHEPKVVYTCDKRKH